MFENEKVTAVAQQREFILVGYSSGSLRVFGIDGIMVSDEKLHHTQGIKSIDGSVILFNNGTFCVLQDLKAPANLCRLPVAQIERVHLFTSEAAAVDLTEISHAATTSTQYIKGQRVVAVGANPVIAVSQEIAVTRPTSISSAVRGVVSLVQKQPKDIQKTIKLLQLSSQFNDPHRSIMSSSRFNNLLALSDDLGRVLVYDIQKQIVVSVIKGLRDSTCQWLSVNGKIYLAGHVGARKIVELFEYPSCQQVDSFEVGADFQLVTDLDVYVKACYGFSNSEGSIMVKDFQTLGMSESEVGQVKISDEFRQVSTSGTFEGLWPYFQNPSISNVLKVSILKKSSFTLQQLKQTLQFVKSDQLTKIVEALELPIEALVVDNTLQTQLQEQTGIWLKPINEIGTVDDVQPFQLLKALDTGTFSDSILKWLLWRASSSEVFKLLLFNDDQVWQLMLQIVEVSEPSIQLAQVIHNACHTLSSFDFSAYSPAETEKGLLVTTIMHCMSKDLFWFNWQQKCKLCHLLQVKHNIDPHPQNIDSSEMMSLHRLASYYHVSSDLQLDENILDIYDRVYQFKAWQSSSYLTERELLHGLQESSNGLVNIYLFQQSLLPILKNSLVTLTDKVKKRPRQDLLAKQISQGAGLGTYQGIETFLELCSRLLKVVSLNSPEQLMNELEQDIDWFNGPIGELYKLYENLHTKPHGFDDLQSLIMVLQLVYQQDLRGFKLQMLWNNLDKVYDFYKQQGVPEQSVKEEREAFVTSALNKSTQDQCKQLAQLWNMQNYDQIVQRMN